MTSSTEQIRSLIYEYAEAVDTARFDRLSQLFAHGALRFGALGGSQLRGNAVGQFFRDTVILYDDGTPRTKHLTTNVSITVDESTGTATARSYATVLQQLPGRGIEPIMSSRYEDKFERVTDVWRFVERLSHRDLAGDISRHARLPKTS